MKIRILPIILILFFLFIFLIFYKGLKNSNIYTPTAIIEKRVPSFVLKSFENNADISSNEIFKKD